MKKANRKMYTKLSEADRAILQSYCAFADGLGACLGEAYEIVVYGFGEDDAFLQHIVNGSPASLTGEDGMIPETVYNLIDQLMNQHSRNEISLAQVFGIRPDGKKCRFSAVGIFGEKKRLIGMLSINLWIDAPFSQMIRAFSFPSFLDDASLPQHISDSGRYNAAIKQEILRVQEAVMGDPGIAAKFKRKEIIRRLHTAGVFKMKNAPLICADTLGVSVATVYMHIRNLESV